MWRTVKLCRGNAEGTCKIHEVMYDGNLEQISCVRGKRFQVVLSVTNLYSELALSKPLAW